MEPIIEVKNLTKIYKLYKKPLYRVIDAMCNTKHYEEYKSLNNVSFTINKGDAVGVLGKNGAGKSTLLKILTGVVQPTDGSVDINGKIAAILELNSGFDEELSGYENIYIKGIMLGFTKIEIDEKIDEIISFADIGKHIYQPVRTYSSGMKSRLGFAIAVSVNPDVLIVDEALSVGDDIFKTKCLAKMTEFRKAGKTIFFVSHSLFTVKSFCTKCMWLKDGELIEYGETGKVTALYENFLKEEKAKKTEELKKKASTKSDNMLERKDYINTTKFKFGNKDGIFSYGEDIKYSFIYDVKKELHDLRWSFTIWDADKKEIYSSDKRSNNYLVNSELGKHRLSIKLEDISLLPGKYYLSGEIRDGAGMLYRGYANKKPFTIETINDYKGSGITYIKHSVVLNESIE